jgi:hypothetical protein
MAVESTFNFDLIAQTLLTFISRDDKDIIEYLTQQFQIYQTGRAQGSQQFQFQGKYRVTVSAHGLDEQSFELPLKNVQATFMFQQPGHSFSAFACSRPISGPGSPTYCDFRTRVFRCMSHIIFSSPDSYDPSMLKYFQQGVFQSIYSKELAAQREIEPVTPDPTRFGPKSASSFELFDYTLKHEKETTIHRKYDLTPTSVSPTVKNQLEYANSNGTEVWLVPGISVSAELIDMCEKGKNDDFGLEVLMVTSRYGVFVDVYIPGTEPMYGIDIFDLLKQLSPLNGSKQINQKKTDSADYEKYASRNDAKTAGKLAKHLAAYIPELDHHHHETSSGLLNSVLSQLEAGRSINTTNIKSKMTIEEFLSKYDGNLYPKLDEYQISQILSLDAAIVLNDGGYIQIHDIVKDEDTATKLLKFIRKVFIIYEFSIFIKTTSTSLSITSDEIIAILAKYHKQKTMSTDHHISIEFLDQTCRDCGMKGCRHVVVKPLPLSGAKGGGTRRKKQKTKKTNKGRKVRNVKRGKKPQFRTTRKRKYRIKNNYTYK